MLKPYFELPRVVHILCAGSFVNRVGSIDKALDSCPYQQIDGYLLVGRSEGGWEALLNIVLALDQLDREALTRMLDRCADMQQEQTSDLELFVELLSEEASLAEDIAAERESRRAKLGYVEPRAAKAFLRGCSRAYAQDRDPITKRYFEGLAVELRTPVAPHALPGPLPSEGLASSAAGNADRDSSLQEMFTEVFSIWQDANPNLSATRLEEITYLVNVLLAGGSGEQGRTLELSEASHAVLATVAFGAALETSAQAALSTHMLREALEQTPADILFRRAAYTLVERGVCEPERPWLYDSLSSLWG